MAIGTIVNNIMEGTLQLVTGIVTETNTKGHQLSTPHPTGEGFFIPHHNN